jgi:hypothetical protein
LRQDSTVAERLILEITESSAIVMPDIVSAFMADMQARGICLRAGPMTNVVIVSAARTAVGSFNGSLRQHPRP